LAAFAAGALQGGELLEAEAHVSVCDECLVMVAAALQSPCNTAGGDIAASGSSDPPASDIVRAASVMAGGEAQRSRRAAQVAERFELGELIAQGGMGCVYAGVDLHTGEPVAIKCLGAAQDAQQPESQARFAREAEILGKLDHPNIVRRIAMVEMGQRWHIVMEYVPGGSLRDALRAQSRLPLAQVLRIGLEVADALARAHHLGIVHRDLKPENVLLAADGSPRLSDFGLARGLDSNLTRSGVLIGTLAYVSPEALCELEVDGRADLWALGVILFEMLTGERPFRGRGTSLLLSAILRQPTPSLTDLRPDAPAALAELLHRLLQKDPAKRIQSARQVAAALEEVARELGDASRRAIAESEPLPPESERVSHVRLTEAWSGLSSGGTAQPARSAAECAPTECAAELALRSSSLSRRVADRC
jgi:serine/threonine protein kinase